MVSFHHFFVHPFSGTLCKIDLNEMNFTVEY